MARKKNRQRDPNDSSDSGGADSAATVPTISCKHISKAVQLNSVKKKLKNGIGTTCDTCAKSSKLPKNSSDASISEEKAVIDENWSYWLCLTCAHVGCGRGQYQHAISHQNTPRSEAHDLVVDIDSWIVWCYPCEQKMAPNSTKKLQECVEYIKRHIQSSAKPAESAVVDNLASVGNEVSAESSSIIPVSGKNDSQENNNSFVIGQKKRVVSKKVVKLSKVRGLMNLGNTCFYNSVLQCLSVTPYLTSVLENLTKSGESFTLPGSAEGDSFEAPEVNGSLGEPGPLTGALFSMLKDMRDPEVHADTLRPQRLLKHIQDAFPQFRGNEQHDAHELLRHLLEGVRSVDLKRFQRVILEKHELLGRKVQCSDVAADVKKRIKLYGQQMQDFTLGVEGIFKGQLVSIVECQDCRHHSTRFESFLDLSLPVMEDKPLPPMRKKEQSEAFAANNTLSKSQLRMQKRATRRNAKLQKNLRNEKMEGQLTIVEEPVKGSDGPESEQSDADVEDNVEQDVSNEGPDKEVAESGYSSDKQNTGESDGTSPSIMTANNERESGGVGVGDESKASASASPCVAESPTAPVSASASSGGPSPTSPLCSMEAQAQPRTAEEWSSFHTPEHDCSGSICSFSCKGNGDARCFTPIDEVLRITIPESGEASIHMSPENPSERPVSRRGFFPGETMGNHVSASGNHVSASNVDFAPELETRLLSLCLNENQRPTQCEPTENISRNGLHDMTNCLHDETDGKKCSHTEKTVIFNHTSICNEECQLSSNPIAGNNSYESNNNSNNNNNDDDDSSRSLFANSKDMASGKNTDLGKECHNETKFKKSGIPGPIAPVENPGIKAIEDGVDSKDEVSGWCKTLAPRHQSEEGECSIISCLNQFTSLELMTGNNKVGCEACTKRHSKDPEGKTVYTNSTKQFLISLPPPVLILHLKRFMMDNFRFKKLQRFVSFPLELDIAPFCSTKCKDSPSFKETQTEVRYSLFGVVEHTGSLNTGHYIAYIKIRSDLEENDPRWAFLPSNRDFVYPKADTRTNGCLQHPNEVEEKWYSVSDSRVVEIAEAKVLKLQAYLLFYERIM